MLTVIWKFSKSPRIFFGTNYFKRGLKTAKKRLTENDVEEIKIPVPWGHIAGKWWGDKSIEPVIAVHGWQDNASSFDKLIPLLNLESIISIDLIGHGLSSHLPPGKVSDIAEHLSIIHRVKKHLNITKVGFLTHSFGSLIVFLYTSLYSKDVRWVVSIECARALLTVFQKDVCGDISNGISAFLKIEKQKQQNKPPIHKLSKMIEMYLEGSFGSIETPEAALTLLKREMEERQPKQSVKDNMLIISDLKNFFEFEEINARTQPAKEQKRIKKYTAQLIENLKQVRKNYKQFKIDESENKYYSLRKDPSIKVQSAHIIDEKLLLEASKDITCPFLSIRATKGYLNGSTKLLYDQTLEILKSSCTYFEHHEMDGLHHLHLNTPDRVALVINDFLHNIA